MILYFPGMHAELLPPKVAALPGLLFDPGLRESPSAGYFRPEGLPLSPDKARAILEDCLRFGEQFRSPAEMAWFGADQALKERGESVSAIRSDLAQRLRADAVSPADEAAPEESEALAQAQFALVLAYSLEERNLEMRGLEQGLRDGWTRFEDSLGLEDGEAREAGLDAASGVNAPAVEPLRLPWRVVLPAMAWFLPEDAIMATTDEEALAAWREMGLDMSPAEGATLPETGAGLPGGCLLVEAPVWKLAGFGREPSSASSAALRRVVRVLMPAAL